MHIDLEKTFDNVSYKDKDSLISYYENRKKKVYEALNRDPRPAHLQGLNEEEAFLRILSYSGLANILEIGYYFSYKANNPNEYNDALYTFATLNTERTKLLSFGGDNSIMFKNIIDYLACNEYERAKELCSPLFGNSKKGHRFAICIFNLLQSILHSDKKLIDLALKDAEKFLQKKNPKLQNNTIEFLIALIDENEVNLNKQLDNIISNYKKSKWIHEYKTPILKHIGNFPIGLYKLAKFSLKEKNVNLIIPNHEVIWKEFCELEQKAKPYIVFNHNLKGINKYL